MRRDDPHKKEIIAFLNGADIQGSRPLENLQWEDIPNPSFEPGWFYRVKPEQRRVFVNVYSSGLTGGLHDSRDKCDLNKDYVGRSGILITTFEDGKMVSQILEKVDES